MRRTNRFSGTVLIALLLLAGFAPAASAEVALSPLDLFGALGDSVAGWWATLTGDQGGLRSFGTASELVPDLDPTEQEVTPHLDPNGAELSFSTDDEGEVAPHIDPNG